ncbi:hypothetical protein ACFFWC_20505 [Plantactinospora siamensis]|uniref:Serine acetyltransferase n=1 Tax=Plantactinospora siamensis TaxID=555372 RepID=A0ABV6P325_9ACTN
MFDTLRQDFRANPDDQLARLVLVVFRFGQWTAARPTVARRICGLGYRLLNLLVLRLGVNSDLPRELSCGPGLRLFHPYGLMLHRGARLGTGVRLYHHVTIGCRDHSGEPVLDDGVVVGAGAMILGPVRVGSNARIAAGALVLDDVPADGLALGPRATIRGPVAGMVRSAPPAGR